MCSLLSGRQRWFSSEYSHMFDNRWSDRESSTGIEDLSLPNRLRSWHLLGRQLMLWWIRQSKLFALFIILHSLTNHYARFRVTGRAEWCRSRFRRRINRANRYRDIVFCNEKYQENRIIQGDFINWTFLGHFSDNWVMWAKMKEK